jgi:diguanylate cyclase (GGDEF)-like protein
VEREIAHIFRATGQKKYLAVKYVFIPPDNVLVHVDDITSQKETEEYLKYIGIHDTMTGLYNRFYAETEISRIKESRNYPVSIIMIDLDGLKEVNDRLGHATGDQMIKDAAEILKLTFRPDDLIARIGGDEFLVILPSMHEDILQDSISRLKENIKSYNAAFISVNLSFSFGVVTANSGDELLECMNKADLLMYQYKAKKKNKS